MLDPDEIGLAAWSETLVGPDPAAVTLCRIAHDAQQALAEAALGRRPLILITMPFSVTQFDHCGRKNVALLGRRG